MTNRSFHVPAARARAISAVKEIERGTSAAVVITVRRSVGSYRHTDLVLGAALAFTTLLVLLFYPQSFPVETMPLDVEERMFFNMPLMHAEDLALQDRALLNVQQLASEAPPRLQDGYALAVDEARRHRDTIARFARFPQRNHALGRISTPDEVAFLKGLPSTAS